MNRRERGAIDLLDTVLRRVGSLTPQNPADVRAIATNLPIATEAAKSLSRAIGAMRGDDWESVDYYLGMAARVSGVPGRRQCVKCARSGGELSENGCPTCGPHAEVRWVAEQGDGDTGSYFCLTSGDIESPRYGGFDVCCDRPDLHRPTSDKEGGPTDVR